MLICLIIGITDGDTLTARCDTPAGAQNVKVRLAEIDAPEKRQAFGTRSRQHLAAMCFRKQAEVRPATVDRYGRTVARVYCDGTDANAEQVRAGMAWAFTRYLTDPGIAALQDQARRRRPAHGRQHPAFGAVGRLRSTPRTAEERRRGEGRSGVPQPFGVGAVGRYQSWNRALRRARHVAAPWSHALVRPAITTCCGQLKNRVPSAHIRRAPAIDARHGQLKAGMRGRPSLALRSDMPNYRATIDRGCPKHHREMFDRRLGHRVGEPPDGPRQWGSGGAADGCDSGPAANIALDVQELHDLGLSLR